MGCPHKHVENVYKDAKKVVQKCKDCGAERTFWITNDVRDQIKQIKKQGDIGINRI